MDPIVERQAVEKLKEGERRQFLALFDDNFERLYKYVCRRVQDVKEREKIVRLSFLDALGQVQTTPTDIPYSVWLYSLAKLRVWEYLERNPEEFRNPALAQNADFEKAREQKDLISRGTEMLSKLSLQEREILFLKFFEEVSDPEVMVVLEENEETIVSEIYKVMKRAHFLLYGESSASSGAYFADLSGLMIRLRDLENIEVSEGFRLNLRVDFHGRILQKNQAIEVENTYKISNNNKMEENNQNNGQTGGGFPDPAKIFVEAAKGMNRQEVEEKTANYVRERAKQSVRDEVPTTPQNEFPTDPVSPVEPIVPGMEATNIDATSDSANLNRDFQKSEDFYDKFDRWKGILTVIPVMIFVVLVGYLAVSWIFGGSLVERGYPNVCESEVQFAEEFSENEKQGIYRDILTELCGEFEGEKAVLISQVDFGSENAQKGELEELKLEVQLENQTLNYKFRKDEWVWKIKSYEKIADSNQKSGEVSRN